MIRFATMEDAADLLTIYANYVLHDTATFEYEVPSLEEFQKRMRSVMTMYPYLVYEENGKLLAYAYAQRYKERAAYQWDAALSIYVDRKVVNRGIGTKLYQVLLTILKQQGIYHAYACITSPNPISIRMHETLGFQQVAAFHNAGYKFDHWLDVIWMDRILQESIGKPKRIHPIRSIMKELPHDLIHLTQT